MTNNHKPVGLILAGGHSRRFGSDKALFHETGQQPQVQQMAAILKPLVTHIFISVNAQNSSEIQRLFQGDLDTTVLVDQVPFIDQGPLSGIFAACQVQKKPVDFLMVPTDYPQLHTATLSHLLAQPSYPVVNGRSHQTIAHFTTETAEVQGFLNTGERRIRLFLEQCCGCQPKTLILKDPTQFNNYNQRSTSNDPT